MKRMMAVTSCLITLSGAVAGCSNSTDKHQPEPSASSTETFDAPEVLSLSNRKITFYSGSNSVEQVSVEGLCSKPEASDGRIYFVCSSNDSRNELSLDSENVDLQIATINLPN